MIDPAAIEAGLREAAAQMKRLHPDYDVDAMVGEESFKLVRRSAEFLKAAAGELTPNEVFNALMVDMEAIFDSDDGARDAAFAKAMQGAKVRSAALAEIAPMDRKAKVAMCTTLQDLGWGICLQKPSFKLDEFDQWLAHNADWALNAWKSRTENAAVRGSMESMLEALGQPADLLKKIEGVSLSKAYEKVSTAFDEKEASDPGRDYERLGGDRKYFRFGGDGEKDAIGYRLAFVRSHLAEERARADLFDGKDLDEVKEGSVLKRIEALTGPVEATMATMDLKARARLRGILTEALLLSDAGSFDECHSALDRLEKELAGGR